MSNIRVKMTTLDYKAAITVILLFADLAQRIITANYQQPIIFDAWAGLALGFWFRASEKKP